MNADIFDHKCESVVVREQRALAVFLNGGGSVVVRQECAWPDETEDPYVLIRPENAEAVARAILRAAAEAFGDEREHVEVVETTSMRSTSSATCNADRQRRYRKRHRNGVPSVTPSNASPVTPSVTPSRQDGTLPLGDVEQSLDGQR